MPRRFFFGVLHGRMVCEDPAGQDFIGLDAARAEAVASALSTSSPTASCAMRTCHTGLRLMESLRIFRD